MDSQLSKDEALTLACATLIASGASEENAMANTNKPIVIKEDLYNKIISLQS